MKMKHLVAALALMAAGSANAAITTAQSGGSELLFNIWYTAGTDDTSDDRSYSRDLAGLDMATFIGSGNAPLASAIDPATAYTFAPDDNFTTFLNYVDSQVALGKAGRSSMLWNVVAADAFGADRLLTTASVVPNSLTRAKLRDMNNLGFDFFAPKINQVSGNEISTMASQDDGSVIATASDDAYALTNFGTFWKTNFTGGNTSSTYGSSMNFYGYFETTGTGTGPASRFDFSENGHVWGLSDGSSFFADDKGQIYAAGTLVYAAPIPEADTYALMLAGLGLVGFLARRRKV